ncbi:MAG: phosphoglycerate dehydrogenase [Promethearchaeota archaeon]
MKKIYVTPRSITKEGHYSLKKLKEAGFELIFGPPGEQPSEEEQLKILPECVAYLAGIEPIGKNILEAAKNLKIISRNGVGVENIDLKVAEQLGIKIRIATASNAQSVAELAIGLIFSAIRFIPICNTYMKKGEWHREKGFELEGKTLGIIGCGNIGKKVVKMALGIGMNVIGYDLYPDDYFNLEKDFKYTNINEIYEKADIISLHSPPSEIPLINANSIAKMHKGVIIINTARAALVDEIAMVEALNERKVSVYATDVYTREPPGLNELISHKYTICTPHIGGYTSESVDRAVEAAVDNIIKELC